MKLGERNMLVEDGVVNMPRKTIPLSKGKLISENISGKYYQAPN